MGKWAVSSRISLNLDHLLVGIILMVLTWLVTIRGVKALGRAAEKLSPLKVGLYLIGGLIVIVTHLGNLPEVFRLIVTEAFSVKASLGAAAALPSRAFWAAAA